jgi:Fe-S-cluster containining protein
MKIPVMTEMSPEQRRILASEKLDTFFSSVPPDLRQRVTSLPKRISQMNARTSIKLQEVLRTADLIFAYAGNFAACARGCGHCCHVHVPIADFEAKYIEDHTGTTPVALGRSLRHDRMEFSGKTPCPFLTNGECSIYQSRPLTCRMHLNFDIDNFWCLHENWNKPEATIPRPDIHPLMDAYHLLCGKTPPVVADIRDFFPNGKTT